MEKAELEELLIKCVHSDKIAANFLMKNLGDINIFHTLLDIVQTSESGDARMKAAYYLSKCDETLLRSAENNLLSLMDDEWDSVAVHIMVALSRIKSSEALKKIIKNRIEPVLHWEARCLEIYFQGDLTETER